MGYIYFVVIVFLILIGYYVWVIFFHNPSKEPLQLDEQKEETILFDFDEPIKVSQDLVMGLPQKEKQKGEGLTEAQVQTEKATERPEATRATSLGESGPINEESNSTSTPPTTAVMENRKPFTAELEYLDFSKGIAKKAMQRMVSAIKALFPIPSSIRLFEVEYNDMYQIDFDKSVNEGRTMFAHLPADSLPEGTN